MMRHCVSGLNAYYSTFITRFSVTTHHQEIWLKRFTYDIIYKISVCTTITAFNELIGNVNPFLYC